MPTIVDIHTGVVTHSMANMLKICIGINARIIVSIWVIAWVHGYASHFDNCF